jgi:hypothetical protein
VRPFVSCQIKPKHSCYDRGHSLFQKSKVSSAPDPTPLTVETNQRHYQGTRQTRTKVSAQSPSVISIDAEAPLTQETLPIYSYKDYTAPKAVLVYTKHEEETNELVACLKPGFVEVMTGAS